MYSFHESQEDFERFFAVVKEAYLRVFKRVGLDAKVTEAAGGSFSEKLSYEFMVLTDAGEDDIVYCPSCTHCANTEVARADAGGECPKCKKGTLAKARAAEVGNVFDLGVKYPTAFGFTYKDKDGKAQTPIVGCYGIGTTRLLGTIVELFSDEKGIIWPESVAPFKVHLVSILGADGEKVRKEADKLYEALVKKGVDVLYDDRDLRPGEKFADSDLLGIPTRIVISEKTLAVRKLEVKNRTTGAVSMLGESEFLQTL
jgi:prolyl-tRNA synthetase